MSKQKTSTRKSIRKSNVQKYVSETFIKNHMGNFYDAEKIALERANRINAKASHTISIDELRNIKSEISEKIKARAFVDNNRVENPHNMNNQFVTDREYRIFETRYTSNSIGKTKEKQYKFYFDINEEQQLHHFDGIVK